MYQLAQPAHASDDVSAIAEYLLSALPAGPLPHPRLTDIEAAILKAYRDALVRILPSYRYSHIRDLRSQLLAAEPSNGTDGRVQASATKYSTGYKRRFGQNDSVGFYAGFSAISDRLDRIGCLLAPMRYLPVDVHHRILACCIFESDVHPVILMNVCSLWKEMICTSPVLWSCIRIYLRGARAISSTANWVAHTGQTCPLHIRLFDLLEKGPQGNDVPDMALLASALNGTMDRWESFSFNAHVYHASTFFYQHMGATSLLKQIDIELKGDVPAQNIVVDFRLPPGAAGVSAVLYLSKHSVEFHPTLSSATSHLDVAFGGRHNLDSFLDFIRPFPNIASLKLQAYKESIPNLLYAPFQLLLGLHVLIAFPHLAELDLDCVPDLSGLAFLEFPSLTSFRADGVKWTAGTFSGIESVLRRCQQLESVVMQGKGSNNIRPTPLRSYIPLPHMTYFYAETTVGFTGILEGLRMPLLDEFHITGVAAAAVARVMECSPLLRAIDIRSLTNVQQLHGPTQLTLLPRAEVIKLRSTAFALLAFVECPHIQALVLCAQDEKSPPPRINHILASRAAAGFASLHQLKLEGLNITTELFTLWLFAFAKGFTPAAAVVQELESRGRLLGVKRWYLKRTVGATNVHYACVRHNHWHIPAWDVIVLAAALAWSPYPRHCARP
ncbi:hypothetical protein BOTBODRAFT_145805 [Botryobasidium botryosum FD-172 SS1]|uniref:F-box domain-containing protein n=1 Tax=Botryobasidium botryosum (strain FD-172 SS1) TaxID=930990 RepID=A0A067MRG6_BOTB1|nr:hypothetical protein BOTBODRAFT_145805 [Botryobasidium botryosum FD-172 SS1]